MKKKISVAIAFSLMGICLLGFAKDEDSQKMEFVENVSTESAVEARSIKLEDDLPASTDELENTVEESIHEILIKKKESINSVNTIFKIIKGE